MIVALVVGLLVALLFVAIVRQLLRLALFFLFAALIVGAAYWLFVDHAPASMSGAAQKAVHGVTTEVGQAGSKAAHRLGREAEKVGDRMAEEAGKQVERAAEAAGKRVEAAATSVREGVEEAISGDKPGATTPATQLSAETTAGAPR